MPLLQKLLYRRVFQGCCALVAFGLGLAGCEKEPIRAYKAPKDPPVPEFVKQADGQASSDQPTIEIIWDVPATWTEDPSPREMRVTTFFAQVEGHDPAEISLNAFGGDVGGLLANINRWRSQVNLAPIEGAQLIDHVELMDGLGGQIAVVREIGENDMQVLGAAMLPGDGQTWFVKVLAHRDICALIEQDLITFAKSLRPKSLGLDASDPEAGMEISAITKRLGTWQAHETWTWTEPTSSMIAMSFVARSDENVKITVTPLRGEGGGLLPNVNRWRAQLGLPSIMSMDDQPMQTLSENAQLFDETSSDGATRTLVAVVEDGAISWYLKIMGPTQGVSDESERFMQFVHHVIAEEKK